MKNQFDREDEPTAIAWEAVDKSQTIMSSMSSAGEPKDLIHESHRGFDEAHKQVREMQKAAAQNWEHDAEPTGLAGLAGRSGDA
jgi:hypothetical protein